MTAFLAGLALGFLVRPVAVSLGELRNAIRMSRP